MAENQDTITHVVEDSKKSLENIFMWLGLIVLVFGLIIIGIIKKNTESFSVGSMVFAMILLILVSSILIFFFKVKDKAGKKIDKLQSDVRVPNPMSKNDLLYKLKNESIKNIEFMNEVKNVTETYPKYIGGNLIYIFEVECLYTNNKGNNRIVVIYNANYPNMHPSILEDPSPSTISRIANNMSTKPEKSDDEESSLTFNPMTGATTQYSKRGHSKETVIKKEKEGKLE